MMRSVVVASALAAALLVGAPAAWADYAAGRQAWEERRYADALGEWRAAAEGGDARAMLALGRLYREGLGALQDFVEAHKWFNLAASRGEAAAVQERNELTARMTPQQVAEAQSRAASWRPGAAPATTAAAVPPPAPAATQPPPSEDPGPPPPRAIREAQQLLQALGYAPGAPDGKWGPRTADAHAAFVRDAGLPQAAALTPQTLQALRTAAETRGVQAGAAEPSGGRAPPPDALHRAVLAGDVEGLEKALAAGADTGRRDAGGMTALMHAADKGYPVLAEMLLAAKADPDVQAPDGATALFMAAAQGHAGVVAQLMRAGAEVSIKGPQGMTAADVARLKQGEAGAGGAIPEMRALSMGLTWAEFEALPKVGEVFRDCEECPEMVVVPPGSFMMGSPDSEEGRYEDEGPVHRVEIARPFAVGVYEVTFAEWDACVSGGGCGGYRSDDEGWGRGSRPVVNVSWEDAQGYVRWLSEKTGGEYRLLSESEWEYAARAGSRTRYHWGDDIGSNRASCVGCGCSFCAEPVPGEENRVQWGSVPPLAPVGSFRANAFGLYDVHGNVWEWVEDCWNRSYTGAPSDGSSWESGDCGRRVLRGGSWFSLPRYLRSAYRSRNVIGYRRSYVGFRVARTLAP